MRALAVVLVLVLLPMAGRAADKRDERSDQEKLQGDWRGVALDVKGMPLPPSSARSLRLHIEKNTFAISQDGKITVRGTFALDPAHKPKTIDLTIADSVQAANKNAVVLGVYAFDKDQLLLCTTKANGQDRPKRLVSKQGSPHSLFTFRRESSPPKPKVP